MINEYDAIVWSPGMTISHMEKMVILKAFRYYRGNKSATATALGISVRTLDTRLEEYKATEAQLKEQADERARKHAEWLDRQRNGTKATYREEGTTPSNKPRAESLAQISAQLKVSVPERKEVQKVLPEQTQPAGKPKSRPGIQKSHEQAGAHVSKRTEPGEAKDGSGQTGNAAPATGTKE